MAALDPATESTLLAAAALAPLAHGGTLERDAYLEAAAEQARRHLDDDAPWLPPVLQGVISGLVATHLLAVSSSNDTSVYSLTSQGFAYLQLVESRLALRSRRGE